MGKKRVLLKPKGVDNAPTKKKKPKNGTNWMLHVVAPVAVAIAAIYMWSDTKSDAKSSSQRKPSSKRKEVVFEEMPSYEEEHPALHAMAKWVESNGGTVDKRLTIREGEHNRGAYFYGGSMTRTERGLVKFLEIPESLFLSSKSMLDPKSAFSKTVKDQDLIDPLIKEEKDELLLAVMVMAESNKPDSFWRPYLNTLQKSKILKYEKESPFFWTGDELKEFQSPFILQSIQRNKDYQKEKLPLVEAIAERYPNLFPDNSNLARDLTWFLYLTNSRSFEFPDESGSDKIVTALVPFLDLPNHSFGDPNALIRDEYKDDDKNDDKENDEESQSKTLFATMVAVSPKKLPHGGELLISYGFASQMYFLEKYGFVDADYENNTKGDCIVLKLPGDTKWIVASDGTFDFKNSQVSTKQATKHEMSTEELFQKVQETIESLPTTLDHDKELFNLPDDEITSIPRNALLIRIRFKQVLHRMLHFLEEGASEEIRNNHGMKDVLFELDFSKSFQSDLTEEDFGQEKDSGQEDGSGQEESGQ